MKRVFIVSLLVLASVSPVAAQSPEETANAKKFFEAGKQAYESGQYLAAAIAFEQAYAISPLAPVAFSMAQAYRKQYVLDKDPTKLKRAVDLYRTYLDAVKQGGRRDDALTNLADLEILLARVEDEQRRAGKGPIAAMPVMQAATRLMISSRTPTAYATIDGDKPAEVPVVREVAAGKHKIHVEAEGFFPEEVEGLAVEGQFVVVEVNLREKPAMVTLKTSGGAELQIDGRPVGEAPFRRPVEVGAGKHFFAVTKRGHHAYTRELTLARGEQLTLKAPLDTTTQRVVSYYVLGTATALAIGGGVTTVLAFLAQSDAQAFQDKIDSGMSLTVDEARQYENKRERRDQMVTFSTILYGSALVAGVTGVLLYIVDSPRVEAPQPSAPAVTPAVTPGGGIGAVWTGTF